MFWDFGQPKTVVSRKKAFLYPEKSFCILKKKFFCIPKKWHPEHTMVKLIRVLATVRENELF